MNAGYRMVEDTLRRQRLNTVCESAQCPNRNECFCRGTASVMILGPVCTRACRFCAVANGVPTPEDPGEPRRAAELVKALGLRHVVVTSVTRDDLADGGARAFAATIAEIRKTTSGRTAVEVLTPDFNGSIEALNTVLDAEPDVFNHNIETVRRLQAKVRPQADYLRSLGVLKNAAARITSVKSGLMVGMGESDDEILRTLADIHATGCRYLTIGQYLSPSRRHLPVSRFVPPERFDDYRREALAMGFKAVASGPLVRSSYMAEELFSSSRDGHPSPGAPHHA